MKKLILLFIVLPFLHSCETEGDLTRDTQKETVIEELTAELKYTATFMPTSGITVKGKAEIYLENAVYKIRLNNFTVSSGPDLKIYLSKAETPFEFVNLGNLTSATVYNVPNQVKVSDYKYILIHCQQFDHLFATALLVEN